MKKVNSLLTGVAMALFFSVRLSAQIIGPPGGGGDIDPGGGDPPADLCDAACLNGTLNISTGFNQSTSTYNTPLANETNWTLVGVPVGSPIVLPAPCFDIPPYLPWWASFPQATWVSPFQYAGYTTNNCPPGGGGAFEFQKCFCVCRETDLNFDFEMLVDDGAEIFLDGNPIASAMAGYQFQWANRLIFNQTFHVLAGQHCLTVKLYNCGAVAMGFAIEGQITGFDLLTPACCSSDARICGTKILDTDCDGAVNPITDPGLAGWTIELRDNLGNLIASTVTDAFGNYCFSPLAPGTYTVNEVNQAGWTQTYPGSPGTHIINIHPGDVGTANFGNCQNPPHPCNVGADFNLQLHDCQLTAQALYPPLAPGYQLVSTHWTFGDGESSNLPNPVHYYATPGNYTVCLTVTVFNGQECCSKTYCQNIKVDKECHGGCNFDAYVDTQFDATTCLYTFNANVSYAGAPITNVYWDFGDGTFGSGTPITHQFPAHGTYKVCMYLFSNINGDCCFKRFCRDVDVTCDPCGPDHGGGGTPPTKLLIPDNTQNAPVNIKISDKNIIVLKQNVPNPFAESTTIHYNIPTSFVKAQMIFTNLDGKVVKAVDIFNKGEGQLNVFADDLSTGIYIYTLVVDGKTIDSKKMNKN